MAAALAPLAIALVLVLSPHMMEALAGQPSQDSEHSLWPPPTNLPADNWFVRPDLLVPPQSYPNALSRSTVDRPDDSPLPQIRAMYILPSDGFDEQLDTNGTINRAITVGLTWLASQTGGRTFRMDTASGELDIGFFRMSKTDAQIAAAGAFVRDEIEAELTAAGIIQPNKLYIVFYGGTSTEACGGASWPPVLPGVVGALYLKGVVPGYLPCAANPFAPTVTSAPGYWEFSWLHEMMHVQGFVASCAPHFVLAGHVSDSPTDLMYAGDQPWHPAVLDLNHDDYYEHSNVGCLDLADSAWLTPSATPPPAAWPDLDQHGLTGSWYEPVTSGQGIEIEFFPDLAAPGTAVIQGAWFTYDGPPAGGEGRQRWYTFSGNAQRGASNIPVTTYRNVGGNFDAPPITNSTVVGAATLAFTDCVSGRLTYYFSDGSGHTGTIPLTRLTPNVTCTIGSAPGTNVDFAFSGNWYDPATSGQGFVFEVNPLAPVFFLTWFTYAPNGQTAGAAGQRWFTGQGIYVTGSRAITLTLYETTGGLFDQSTSPAPTTVAVGTATVALISCTSARLDFNFAGGSEAGKSGTIALQRVGPSAPGCEP